MKQAVNRLCIAFAFAFGCGLSPIMPGTIGSLPGLALGAAIRIAADSLPESSPWSWRPALIVILLLLAALFAWWTIDRTERSLGIHDDQRIVIDEVVGQATCVAFVPLAWQWYLAGFVLFRLLDIWKPALIGRIDREAPGAVGTLGDDLLAGVVAAVLLAVARQAASMVS
jgi:phosphatidylglycerophosphatase A